MSYIRKGGALPIPPPPPALPLQAAKGRKLPPPPPPALSPKIVNSITKNKIQKAAVVVNSMKKGVTPGVPGVPIPIAGEDYKGRVNSTIDPAYDVYLEMYYADFSIKDKDGFMKLFRMFGNTAQEVIQYISNFKENVKVHGMMRAAEPITLNSIIRQLQTYKEQI